MKTTLQVRVRNVRVMNYLSLIAAFLLMMSASVVTAQLADPFAHPKFVQDLPIIKDLGLRIDLTNGTNGTITAKMVEFNQKLGLYDVFGNQLKTKVWGYQFPGLPPTYPGATIVAMKDKAVDIRWENHLPGHFLPVDATLHMAHPGNIHTPAEIALWYAAGNVPTVAHLHGGHTESASDGLPEAWFTQNFAEKGDYFVKQNYHYDNDQEGATLWYHDHALGITRLNVYAGLAGFYLLRDDNELNKINNGILPSGDYEIEIVIQDRSFDANGQLFLPSVDGDPFFGGTLDGQIDLGGISPSIVAEFFGEYILVNGKAWPRLKAEQTKYRLRMLNGSDSRVYNLSIQDELGMVIPFMQIGTDNGLLPKPVQLSNLILAPGERADLVVDFTGLKGYFTMVNTGPDGPFKGNNFNPDVTRPTGQIMQFKVNPKKNIPAFMVDLGTQLRPDIVALPQNGATVRKLALFEGADADGRLQPLLGIINGDQEKGINGITNGSLAWFEEITENPMVGDVEIWEVYNATEDAHPIHLHLVSFQILDRTPYDAQVLPQSQLQHDGRAGTGGYIVESTINMIGFKEFPAANEKGWKDTFVVPPGYVGRVIARFDRPGRYVWHCHILSHEDHEMMRPYHVGPIDAGARIASSIERDIRNFPNPFHQNTSVLFEIAKGQNIDFSVFDVQGKLLYQNRKFYQSGKNAIFWEGFDKEGKLLPTGVYLYRLQGDNFVESKKLVIER